MLRAFFLAAVVLLAVAGADDFSGPLHLTLATESWGTLFYVPSELKDYDYVPDPAGGLRTMKGRLGTVTIADAGIACYNITFPKGGQLTVDYRPGHVQVNFYGQTYDFTHVKNADLDELAVKMPGDEIKYVFTRHDITVEGKKGKSRITETEGDYRVQSSAGTYSYKPTDGGGFQVRGAPLVHFPYMYRGAIFKSAGVGVFIDFKKLEPDSPLFRFTEWEPMLVFSK